MYSINPVKLPVLSLCYGGLFQLKRLKNGPYWAHATEHCFNYSSERTGPYDPYWARATAVLFLSLNTQTFAIYATSETYFWFFPCKEFALKLRN